MTGTGRMPAAPPGAEAHQALLSRLAEAQRQAAMAEQAAAAVAGTLDAMAAETSPEAAVSVLLDRIARHFPGAVPMLLCCDDQEVRIAAAPAGVPVGATLLTDPAVLARSRRIVGPRRMGWWRPAPGMDDAAVLALAPLRLRGEPAMALACVHADPDGLCINAARFLGQLTRSAAHVLESRRQAARTQRLAERLGGTPAGGSARMNGPAPLFDAPFHAVSRALDRATESQSLVLAILNDLLRANDADTDAAIETALARLGAFYGSDRTYVLRVRDDRWVSNTHEWVAGGIAPMKHALQDVPVEFIGQWLPRLRAGRPMAVPDVAALPDDAVEKPLLLMQGIRSILLVPTLAEGRLSSFVGYDVVRARRSFEPADVLTLQSVANAIDKVLNERDARSASRSAHAALSQAAAEAEAARRTLAAAVETLDDGFVCFDADDRLVLCNRRFREIHPLSAPAMTPGARFEDILRHGLQAGEFTDAAGREEQWLAERMAAHRLPEHEHEQQLSDGRWLRVFERAMPDGGRVGLRVDITALKAAEARALSQRAMAMDASRDGMAVADAAGRIIYMNPAHLAMFGFDDEAEVLGRDWHILYGPEERARIETEAMATLRENGSWLGEVPGRTVDGKVVEQEVSLNRMPDGGVMCITRDISERRRADAERSRLREALQLAQRREALGQLAAGLAHDFNNLLATIGGSAALAAAAAPEGHPARDHTRRIQAATDRAAGLVHRLLKLGGRPARRRRIDLRTPLREAADLAATGLPATVRLRLDTPGRRLDFTADPTDMVQVVLNLALNARDALGPDGGEISLSLRPASDDDLSGPWASGRPDPARPHVCLCVNDTGPGMPPSIAGQAFRPYFSTKGDNGNGLGLAIVGSIVNAYGGAIGLDTSPGRGCRFRVVLPIDGAQAPPAVPAAPVTTDRLRGRAILLVDDSEDLLEVLTGFLEAAGARVAATPEPADALEVLREEPRRWDLLITDYDMAGMNGAELARAARLVVPAMPVLLVTALPERHERWREDGFAGMIGKPVTRDRLLGAAATALSFWPREAET